MKIDKLKKMAVLESLLKIVIIALILLLMVMGITKL